MLQSLNQVEHSIKIVIIGIGSIGNGLVFQTQITPKMECIGIADIRIERAIACAEWLELDYQVVQSKTELTAAVEAGKLAITDNGQLLAQCELADALIESSSAILEGAEHAITALKHGLHVIMMNYEADLMYGPLLLSIAEAEGLVYSSSDGDQPTVIKRMIDEILFWGFDLVMAGNIKGYLDRYVNPTTIVPEADKRNLDYKMCTSYTDGTKLGVEMAVLANALGLRTAVPGMIGPRANHISELFDLFDFDALWGSDRQPLVDYVLGARPKGGVFVIAHTDRVFQQFTLDWFPPDMGPGPYYLFYRPYHLGHIEALATVVDAVLNSRSVLKPDFGFQTNVIAYARKDLKSGDKLDGLGGYTCYGLIENLAENSHLGLPICLADEVILRRDINKDERIAFQDVLYDSSAPQFRLHAEALAVGSKNVK
jgi:predicted homoserine dehydrogenase-like protein